ncbi:F0F1 ATP synthase subunit B [Agathobaculum sp. Marseille-P7918]|uniref:F0F1 ATP synthase subunit B n=1 Tax=Agathobaculum sp. Marseille-P7918 TaxID=2479843 RepID=UPI000F640A1D|nr:F0F1 ATP synthase subunit B [Agathobaculum sp. Marseille-P7918]
MILNLNAQIIWVFVNLLVLFLLMKKFLFGPVTKMLDERAKDVSATLDRAESRLAEAEQSKASSDEQLAQAQSEAARIIAAAKQRGEREYERRVAEAEQAVQRLNAQAAQQREADRAAMLADAKKQIAALVLLTTAKVSQCRLDGETDRSMLDSFLQEEAGDAL